MRHLHQIATLLVAFVGIVLPVATTAADQQLLTLSGASYTVDFSRENGSIVRFASRGRPDSIWRSGEHGLWQVAGGGDQRVDAAQFSPASPDRRHSSETPSELEMSLTEPTTAPGSTSRIMS